MTMKLSAVDAWISKGDVVPIARCEATLPHVSGLYAFYLNDRSELHPAFRDRLSISPHASRLYIGKASFSLYKRIWEQECQHKSPGTFFRSVGVMLGKVSPSGGKNFRFSPTDQLATIAWIKANLSVSWIPLPSAGINNIENQLIASHKPLLNIQNNPLAFPLLKDLREWSQHVDRRIGTHPLNR